MAFPLTRIDAGSRICVMPRAEVDSYPADVEEPKRSTLQELRLMIREVVPEAEEGISYGVPAFRLRGKGRLRVHSVQEPSQLPT